MSREASGAKRINLGPLRCTTYADQTVTSSAASVLALNSGRAYVIIGNQSDGVPIRVGDSNITANRGVRINPGETATLDYRGQLYAISEGADVTVDVNEFLYGEA